MSKTLMNITVKNLHEIYLNCLFYSKKFFLFSNKMKLLPLCI